MTAETIAKALGGRKAGAAWMARCPAHDDHRPSFSIGDGRRQPVVFRCHAGCSPAEVISALRGLNLWPEKRERETRFDDQEVARKRHAEEHIPQPGEADDGEGKRQRAPASDRRVRAA